MPTRQTQSAKPTIRARAGAFAAAAALVFPLCRRKPKHCAF